MRTIWWRKGVVYTFDQRKLPRRLTPLRLATSNQVARAIENMSIRGAPLIGAAAALAMAQVAYQSRAKSGEAFIQRLEKAAVRLRATRPTGVNLFNALEQVLETAKRSEGDVDALKRSVVEKCLGLVEEDVKVNRAIARNGARLLEDGDTVLTHCNAGALATVEVGTALGVIKEAVKEGKRMEVVATETRPLLQGARLTAYELVRDGIPTRLITDSMAGYLMFRRRVHKVIVGADRILRSGHVINKIGTYPLAVLAKEHRIPFYVAAPTSTFDRRSSVEDIVIEERDAREVLEFQGRRVAPRGVVASNPAFDITPPHLVSGIITEKGIVAPRPEEIQRILPEDS